VAPPSDWCIAHATRPTVSASSLFLHKPNQDSGPNPDTPGKNSSVIAARRLTPGPQNATTHNSSSRGRVVVPCSREDEIMHSKWQISLVLGLTLTLGNAVVRADEAADMKALIAKAIKAMGGEKNLAKYRAATLKFKGKIYFSDTGLPATFEMSVQHPGQQKLTINLENCGQTFTFIQVLNKDKGWEKQGDAEAKAMGKDQLAEEKEQMYARSLTMLLPLRDKGLKLSSVGEVKIDDKDAVGIRVSSKGHRDVNLYFDKKTNLLLKSETVAKAMGSDKEVPAETFFMDYKEQDGVKHPMKLVYKQDGKKFVEVTETTEFKLLEKVDDSEFDKP
jgi:hypothetical protein